MADFSYMPMPGPKYHKKKKATNMSVTTRVSPRQPHPIKRTEDAYFDNEAIKAIDDCLASEYPELYSDEIQQALDGQRPSYAPGQVMKVWNNSNPERHEQNPNLQRTVCASCKKYIEWDVTTGRQDIWDMGHRPGFEYKRTLEALRNREMDYYTFIEKFQNPDNYQVEHPHCNRSHKYEK